ncbi:DUF3120 domain-containing protein [Halotia branconii]|uniref:DUF3120 domain-containing protein n=1 Tax=Halotia branconii CENA392 TaxID=1539056 RepID=A0AAJ6NSS7_9CYAN|nr:DUF3120 domain-containing protein [Halotia branconii]WGV26053.1 DUF3120 domain-containing protein [Halotia branconii CENA392]
MLNNTLSSYNTSTNSIDTKLHATDTGQINIRELESTLSLSPSFLISISSRQTWLVFAAAVFLVSVPVFIEAPLVRSLPFISLAITGFWVWLSFKLMSRPATYLWGDLLLGFSWSWLAGAIYWGWLRWEPVWHLPVESIGLPFACWCLLRNWGKVGNFFYLGSLLGTVLTDVYFYIVDLMPYWRQIMQVEPAGAPLILQNALIQVQTPWGQTWAVILASVLLIAGILPLRQRQRHWYAFGGAVLSTILVDSLFLLAAYAA